MAAAGEDEAKIRAREAHWRHIQTLLEQPDGYAQYRREYGTAAALSADRWRFIRVNMASDATVGLRHFATPVHLISAGATSTSTRMKPSVCIGKRSRPRC